MPGAKWLLSDDIWPQVLSEGWLAMYDALKNFDPAKGDPRKTETQKFRTFANDYIEGRVLKLLKEAGWYESLESYDDIAARPLTPGIFKGVTARPLTPGDFMGVTNDPNEYNELMAMLREQIDKLPVRLRGKGATGYLVASCGSRGQNTHRCLASEQ